MTIAQQVGRVSQLVENDTLRREFFQVARLLCKHRGDAGAAHAEAQGKRMSPRVVTVLQKAAVSPLGLSEALADYQVMAAAFSESLRSLSVFDAMLADGMTPAPLRSRGVAVTTGITGAVKPEGQVKIIGSLVLGNALVEPKKKRGHHRGDRGSRERRGCAGACAVRKRVAKGRCSRDRFGFPE
jgi:hypothetical protein